MKKSAVLALNPFLSQVIINYIFVQEGINATYCLSRFEGKRPGPVMTSVQGIDSTSMREPTVPGAAGAFYALLYLLYPTILPPPLGTLALTLHRRPR